MRKASKEMMKGGKHMMPGMPMPMMDSMMARPTRKKARKKKKT